MYCQPHSSERGETTLIALPAGSEARRDTQTVLDVGRCTAFDKPIQQRGIELFLDAMLKGSLPLWILKIHIRAVAHQELRCLELFPTPAGERARNGVTPTTISIGAPA